MAGLYHKQYEHDACGVGFTADINNSPSHQIVLDGLTMLKNLAHRGAIGGDLKTGDGAGILVQIPHGFFSGVCDFDLPEPGSYGIAMMFLPVEKKIRDQIMAKTFSVIKEHGGIILGQRDVPARPDCLGEIALRTMPFISQLFISVDNSGEEDLERKLYVIRRMMEKQAESDGHSADDCYVTSCSARTIVYKGMFLATSWKSFIPT